jgi:cation:H+ antiporter
MHLLLFNFSPSQTWIQVVLLVIGIVAVMKSAGWLTDGSVGIATRMGIPQLVIGLTIVAMGTSMPEFFVSLMSALGGKPGLAVGNVVGSNIFNASLIVGVAAMVAPIAILPDTVKRDIPFALVASVVLMMMCLDGNISRLDAVILFVLFIVFMYFTLLEAKKMRTDMSQEEQPVKMSVGKSTVLIVSGLAGLIIGSEVFVDNASALAHTLGVSDAVIGLTIVACGTSLPELATSTVAASRGNSGIAIGNVLGSNVFNILMILGVTGMVSPMSVQGITFVDLSVMVIAMILLWLFSFSKYRIERWEGAALTVFFIGYISYLLYQV